MIKSFEDFFTEEEKVNLLLKKLGIENYTINSDFSIDINGNVNLSNKKIIGKIPIKFRYVSGDFNCGGCDLISLEGSPSKVGGSFIAGQNKLTSLKGCPSEIGKSFYCHRNNLTDLKFIPQYITEDLYCSDNRINTLKNGPIKVKGRFVASDNLLKTFDGNLKYVGKLYCNNNRFYSIEGMPEVYDHIDFSDNLIRDFDGFPEDWEGNVNFRNNPVFDYIKQYNSDEEQCKAIYWINELGAIQNGKVVDERMDEVINIMKRIK